MAILYGNERESLTPSHTQVYQATHDGNNYLPYMNRSFISFSYGGKNIEDFNLLATIDGNRLSRDAYSSFDDLTTIYDTLHGQFYWGSYYRANSLSFNLSTDGMTQVELDNFKQWFQPGEGKELILAEHPNRAIIARVSQAPQLKLLPFEKKIIIPISSSANAEANEQTIVNNYTTSTTIYKGEIILDFVMDEPFWYARQNILGNQDVLQGFFSEKWIDANGNAVQVRDTPDALKIIYEDHIPLGSTTNLSVFLGGNVFATVIFKPNAKIVSPVTEEEYNNYSVSLDPETRAVYFNNGDTEINGSYYFPASGQNNLDYYKYYTGAVIAWQDENQQYHGARVGGADLSSLEENDSGVTLYNSQYVHLYYAGTAPSPLKIKFQLTPIINNYIIVSPQNKYSNPSKPYNTITFEATKKHVFKFTTPNIYTSFNQTIQIFDEFVRQGVAWLTIREYIRDLVKHPIVRAWANCVMNRYDKADGSGYIGSNITVNDLKEGMKYLFCNEFGELMPANFEFDAKLGKAVGTFKVRNPKLIINENEINSWNELGGGSEKILTIVENVGDMVKSSYLILDERNVLNDSYRIQAWAQDHPDYSYKITHDLSNSLEHLQFEFKNLYL